MGYKPYTRTICPSCRTRYLLRDEPTCYECAAPRPLDAEFDRITALLRSGKPVKYAAVVVCQPPSHVTSEVERISALRRRPARKVERRLPAMAEFAV